MLDVSRKILCDSRVRKTPQRDLHQVSMHFYFMQCEIFHTIQFFLLIHIHVTIDVKLVKKVINL